MTNLATHILYAQSASSPLELLWAKGLSGSKYEVGEKVVADKIGNVYMIGTFEGQLNMPEININLISKGGKDIFISKWNSEGQLINATAIGSNYDDKANALKIDKDNKVYIAGYKEKISSPNGYDEIEKDMFWSVYDTSLKVKNTLTIASTADEEILNLDIDNENNIVVSGYFRNEITFDTNGSDLTFATKGYSDAFFAKYDREGKCLWAKTLNLVTINTTLYSQVDKSGSIILAGIFQSRCDFDPSAGQTFLTSTSYTQDIFIAKYTSNGTFISADKIGGNGWEQLHDMKIDNAGNLILAGSFYGLVDFGLEIKQKKLIAKLQDGFIVSYAPNREIIFANRFTAISERSKPSISIDTNNSIYLTGSFLDNAEFNNVPTSTISSAGGSDLFVAHYSQSGNFDYEQTLGYNESEVAAYCYFANNTLYISGVYEGNSILKTQNNEIALTNKGMGDAFVIALQTDYKPNQNYSLAGRINSSGQEIVDCQVKLWEKSATNELIELQTMMSSNGTFQFNNLPKSTYTLEVIPQSEAKFRFKTTYYVNKASLAAANWINLFGNATELDLQLIPYAKNARAENQWIQVYANSDNETLNIHCSEAINSPSNLKIFDTRGILIYERSFLAQETVSVKQLSLPEVPQGVYCGIITNSDYEPYLFKYIK